MYDESEDEYQESDEEGAFEPDQISPKADKKAEEKKSTKKRAQDGRPKEPTKPKGKP